MKKGLKITFLLSTILLFAKCDTLTKKNLIESEETAY